MVSWIDDEPEAVDALRGEGCPARDMTDLLAAGTSRMGGALADALAFADALAARIPAAVSACAAADPVWLERTASGDAPAPKRRQPRKASRRVDGGADLAVGWSGIPGGV